MTLLQMRYFLAVCRYQNITHAAGELHIAQSTLSQSMQALEDETGLNLFLRTGRTIMISQAGQQLAQKLARLLQQVDQVESEIHDMALRHSKVRIAIPQQQASYLMPYLLSEFHQQHPEIQLDITEPYGLEAVRLVHDEKVDLAVINSDDSNQPDIHYRRLASRPIGFVVWEDHPLASRTSITLEEAASMPVAMLSEEFYVTRVVLRAMHQHDLTPKVRYFSPHLSTLYSLLRHHTLPAILFERSLVEMPGLVTIPFAEGLRLTGAILTKKNRQSSKDQRLVMKFIFEKLSAIPSQE
ncbi:MAG: LysR substrate-binding domain-containing protein [Selenomonadaceae bacterium]|nr:LysR substrate-binding domain-containing protein [Selenomonadaceae bacterium]